MPKAEYKECICQHQVLGTPQKSSDVVTRRIRNPDCPHHGKADARVLKKRQAVAKDLREQERQREAESFNRWWGRHGGNAPMVDLEAAYRAGWKASLRSRRPR